MNSNSSSRRSMVTPSNLAFQYASIPLHPHFILFKMNHPFRPLPHLYNTEWQLCALGHDDDDDDDGGGGGGGGDQCRNNQYQ